MTGLLTSNKFYALNGTHVVDLVEIVPADVAPSPNHDGQTYL